MRKLSKIKSTLIAVGIGMALSASAQAAEVTLKLQHFLPKQAPAHSALALAWKDAVEKESNGRIEVKVFPAMQLGGKAPNLVDQVRDGFVDVVWTLPGYTPGRFPAISAFELPFMVSNAEQTSQALQAYYENNDAVKAEFDSVHPLFFFTHARGLVHTKGKAFNTLDDLKGMKIRIPSRPVAETMKALGATPVSMPVPAMPEALAKNVIDGTVVPWEVVPAFRLHELAENSTSIEGDRGLYTSVFLFAMNKKKYDKLPDDLKTVIDNNSGMKWSKEMGAIWDKAELPGQAMATKRKNNLISLPAADIEKMKVVSETVYKGWVDDMNSKDLDGQALLDSAQSLLDEYSSK